MGSASSRETPDTAAIPLCPRTGYTLLCMKANSGLSDIVALLRQSEFFSRLLDDDLFWLASKCELAAFPSGTALFRTGDKAQRFFILRSGVVAASRVDVSGHVEEMARFEAGDVVGDFDFSRGAMYDAEADCVEDCEILVFPRRGETMDDLARERPDISARILLRSVAMISSRVRSTQALISDNAPWVRELRRQMYTDASTGLWSRTFLDDELQRSLEAPAAIVLFKPDRFKELCDTWGHGAGDVAMERIAAILKEEVRAIRKAWAIRLRSNETAIVASACRPEQAIELAGRVQAAYARMELGAVTGDPSFHLSASVALASWPQDGRDFKGLVEQVYGLLLRAWKDGGARIYRLSGDTSIPVEPRVKSSTPGARSGSPEAGR